MADPIPSVDFALLSGSAGWGINFPADLGDENVRIVANGLSFETPFGPQDGWQVLELDGSITEDGQHRRVLNLYSHGWPLDSVDPQCHLKAFWVLRDAGVNRILADSTCGSLNRALRPLDFVVTGDIIDLTASGESLLPGRLRMLCTGEALICPRGGEVLAKEATERWLDNGRVYGPSYQLVAGVAKGPRFETPAEARALAALGADVVNQSIGSEATFAREIGSCFVSSSYVTNYVSGVLPKSVASGAVDGAHDTVKDLAVRVSLRTIASWPAGPCECQSQRQQRAPAYLQAARDQLTRTVPGDSGSREGSGT